MNQSNWKLREIINDTIIYSTIESKAEKGRPVIGIYITTLNWQPIIPLKIDINTGEIGGPSAGSMFALEILNQLSSNNLTGGRKIAVRAHKP